MEKKLLVLFLTLILTLLGMNVSFSQLNKMEYGIRAGLNLANSNSKTDSLSEEFGGDINRKIFPRLGIGGFIEYPVSNMLSIQLNVLYNQKGEKFEGTAVVPGVGIIDVKITNKFDYLSIPLFAKLNFLESEASPYLILGPELSFLLSAKQKSEADIMVVGLDTVLIDQDIKDYLKSTEFSLNIGAGIEFPISTFTAFVEGRYGLGVTKVNKEGSEDIKTNVIYINIGLKFGKK
jgi:hypothetical protein